MSKFKTLTKLTSTIGAESHPVRNFLVYKQLGFELDCKLQAELLGVKSTNKFSQKINYINNSNPLAIAANECKNIENEYRTDAIA